MIAALGTHHDLLATEPRYRELMSSDHIDRDGDDGQATPGLAAGARR